ALVDGNVQLAVHQRPARLDVGDVEKVLIGAARITDAELLAHGRARAVAAGEECGLARRSSQMRHDTAARFLEIEQLSLSLDAHVQLFEPLDEEALVLVLRVDEPVWIGAPAQAQLAELDVRGLPGSGPEVRCGEHQPGFDDLIGEAELAIELQRARLQRQRARSGAGLGSLIDDAGPDAEPGEPESEDEARRAGADDEHFGVHASHLYRARVRAALRAAERRKAGPLVRSAFFAAALRSRALRWRAALRVCAGSARRESDDRGSRRSAPRTAPCRRAARSCRRCPRERSLC